MDVFPLVNTPSFYVVNSLGCYFVTGFLPDAVDDPGISEVTLPSLQLSPNPFKEGTKISWHESPGQELSLSIYNLKGQLIRSLKGNSGPAETYLYWDGTKADGSKAASGIYLLSLQDASGKALARYRAVILK